MTGGAARGVVWTVANYGLTKVVTFATTIVLARLLLPADFGTVALAGTVVILLSFLRDLGVGNTLILHPDLDARGQGTVLSLMVGTSFVAAALGVVLAPLVASFFRNDQLESVLVVLSLAISLSGLAAFNEVVLQRELEFRKRFYAGVAQVLAYAVVAIVLAASGAGVWSLAGGQVAHILVGTVATTFFARSYLVRPAWHPASALLAVRTGRGFIAQLLLYFVQQNADYVAIGRTLGATQTGYYTTAFRIAEIPMQALSEPVARVTFPIFAAMHSRGQDPRDAFLRVLRLVAIVAFPLGVVLSAVADPLVEAVYGDRWLGMIPALTVLGLWAATRPVQNTVAWLLNSVGHAGTAAKASGILTLPLVGAIVLAADRGGILGVAWVVLGYAAVQTLVTGWLVRRHSSCGARDQLRAVLPVLVASVPAWCAGRLVAQTDLVPLAAAGAGIGVTLGVYLPVLHLVDREAVRGARAELRRILGRSGDAEDAAADA